VTLLPVFHGSFLRFLRSLLFLLLLLHVLFHRVPRLGLRGIGLGTGNGRHEKRLTEKHKQDASRNFVHKLSHEAGFCGISQRELPVMKNLSRRPGKAIVPHQNIPDSHIGSNAPDTRKGASGLRASALRQRWKEFTAGNWPGLTNS
jgi:hypothetical protein